MSRPLRLLSCLAALLAIGCTGDSGKRPDTSASDAPRQAAAAAPRCFRSASSVLLGPPTSSGQQGKGPGWIRIDGAPGANGAATLVDPEAKGYQASWRRVDGDSIDVVAFDDFLRVELRLALSDSLVSGRAAAHSDAAVERDSAGQLGDLRRSWRFSATAASCDSMPAGAPQAQ